MYIVPMRDLKDTVKIEKLCSETDGPIFITKNGYGKLVVMNIDYYEKTIKNLLEASQINKGLDDLKNGKVKDGKSVLDSIKQKYEI